MFELAMIVDDDAVSNLISERQIRRSQVARRVCCFTDAPRALDLLLQGQLLPDLLFLELQMRNLGGWEFLDALAPNLLADSLQIYILSAWIYGEDYLRVQLHPLVRGMALKPLNRLSLRALLDPGPSGDIFP